jgi:putative addiction module killer protein
MMDIREYLDRIGRNPFREWRSGLSAEARARVTAALFRLAHGNFSNVEGIGAGAFEYKIHFGPGYRVYFGKVRDELVILIGGGTKKSQENDIRLALTRWEDYKERAKLRKKE